MNRFYPTIAFPLLSVAMILLFANALQAGEWFMKKDIVTGWDVYTLQQGDTRVRVVPAAGANAFSIQHQGVEYLRVPEELKKLPGVGFGVPILYPMPNRVRGAKFQFEGKAFTFPKNGRGHFIHGLVHSEAFKVESTSNDDDSASLTCSLKFSPGARPHGLFPLEHVFRVTISVRENAVRWTYEVDNQSGKKNVPFGVGLHPYFVYQNSRDATYLKVPATALMDSPEQLPSGKLLELDGHALDARTARSLKGYDADDVFIGMKTDQPTRVEFREVKRNVTLQASPEFTHLVVWTPDQPYFGIENQTCSTDAHNLTSDGHGEVANLQICPPGERMSGFVEYEFDHLNNG